MISQSDIFIIIDDVKFSYQSWQHRNKFKTPKGLEFFTIPVASDYVGNYNLYVDECQNCGMYSTLANDVFVVNASSASLAASIAS